MKIDFNRLNKLAGLPVASKNSRSLNESFYVNEADEEKKEEEEKVDEGSYHEKDELEEGHGHHDIEENMNEMIEVDEVMLVQELRRAKKLMAESARRNNRLKKNLVEAKLKTIIEEEVENVLSDLNLNSSWVYGKNKPSRSRKGGVHQGFFGGPGFR